MQRINTSFVIALLPVAACAVEEQGRPLGDLAQAEASEEAEEPGTLVASEQTRKEIGVVFWRSEPFGPGARLQGLDVAGGVIVDVAFKTEVDDDGARQAVLIRNLGSAGGDLVLHADGTTNEPTLPEGVVNALARFEADADGAGAELLGFGFREWGFSCSFSFAYNAAKCGAAIAVCLSTGLLGCIVGAFACYDALDDFMQECAADVDGLPNGDDDGGTPGGDIGTGSVGDSCSRNANCAAGLYCDDFFGWCAS